LSTPQKASAPNQQNAAQPPPPPLPPPRLESRPTGDRSKIKPEDLLVSMRSLKKVNRKDVYDPGMKFLKIPVFVVACDQYCFIPCIACT
jgi:hypothetical protein